MTGNISFYLVLCGVIHAASMAACIAIFSSDALRLRFLRAGKAVQKSIVILVMGPVAAMPVFPQPFIYSDSFILPAAGAGCVAVAAFLWGAALLRIGFIPGVRESRGLVTGGAYSVVRNPIYAGNVLILPGLALVFNSFHALLFSPVVFVLFAVLVVAEEKGLLAAYGREYRNYTKAVRYRIIPFVF